MTMIVSLFSLILSAAYGFWCVLNRLWDFRGSARRASYHPDAPTMDALRERGELTWILLYSQIAMFGLGAVSLALTLWLTYGSKFF